MHRTDLRKTEDVFNRVMIKDNVASVAYLENKETHMRFLIANAHLHWDPAYKDVKLVQTAMLMDEIQRLINAWSAHPGNHAIHQIIRNDSSKLPVIICGDFNSTPQSGVYEFLSNGHVPQNHEDFGSYTYGTFTEEGLSHQLGLKSSYSHIGELSFTNLTPSFKGVIDYIWYSSTTLNVTGLLGDVDREYISNVIGFPNWHHPSDHVPIIASFKIKDLSNVSQQRSIKFK